MAETMRERSRDERDLEVDVPVHCGTETSSTGRLISERLAKTSPHFMVGAQKNTGRRKEEEL